MDLISERLEMVWQIHVWGANDAQRYTRGVAGDIANTGNSNSGGFYERLNIVCNPKLENPTTAQWFNRAAFTFGNLDAVR